MNKDLKVTFEIPPELDTNKPYVWIATWGGAGFLGPAPGTWGSFAGLLCGIPILWISGITGLLFATILVITLGLWAAYAFDKVLEEHDSKMIVIDEIAGVWIAMLPAALNPLLLLLSFLLFRAFDIYKPGPIGVFDRDIRGAAGVMGDDLLAGLAAALCVWGISLVL